MSILPIRASEELSAESEDVLPVKISKDLAAANGGTFELSGPTYLTCVDWNDEHHRRSVMASLVKGVNVLELDRQKGRVGPQALAPRWWEFFHFQLIQQLVDNADESIFGAVYKYKPPMSNSNHSVEGSPSYVIAIRGTINGSSFRRDMKLNLQVLLNRIHRASRFEIAMQTARNLIALFDDLNVWLAGYSLGSAIAMLVGRNLAKTGIFLEAYLFNPPFDSLPIERIGYDKLKNGLRIARGFITAGLSLVLIRERHRSRSDSAFDALSAWIPHLFVNPADFICSEYIGYFESRKMMVEIGAGYIARLATQNSITGVLLGALGEDSERLHLIPSANLTINLSPLRKFKHAHAISQWWKADLRMQSETYSYR